MGKEIWRCSGCAGNGNGGFRERVSDFSLRSQAIRSLDRFESRREVVLRGEDNAWTPGSGVSSNSLR